MECQNHIKRETTIMAASTVIPLINALLHGKKWNEIRLWRGDSFTERQLSFSNY